MSRYRKIDPRIWNDEKFARLSDDGKFAFIFVLTHPHMTALGAMRATVAGLAGELRWQPKRMKRAVMEAVGLGMLVVNEDAAFTGAPNFIRFNEPEGPNSVTKAWIAALDLIPECPEKRDLIARCGSYLDGKPDAFKNAMGDAIRHAFPVASPIQEQEPEQEQKPEPKQEKEPKKSRARDARQSTRLPLSDDFVLTSAMTDAAKAAGCTNPDAAFSQFQNHHRAKHTLNVRWDAAWRAWIGNHGRYGCPCQDSRGNRSRTTYRDFPSNEEGV